MGLYCGKETVLENTRKKFSTESLEISPTRNSNDKVSIVTSGGQRYCLQMTSSMITLDDSSHVSQSVPKTSSVVVLTLSIVTAANHTENITLKELQINWGELSLTRQVPEKIFAMILQTSYSIYAILDRTSSHVSLVTLTAICENEQINLSSYLSEKSKATNEEIEAFNSTIQDYRHSKDKLRKSKTDDRRRRKNSDSSFDGSFRDLTKSDSVHLIDETTCSIEESYIREYGLKVDFYRKQSTEIKRKGKRRSRNETKKKDHQDFINQGSRMVGSITGKSSQVCKNASSNNDTRNSSESSEAISIRSRRSGISISSYGGNTSPFASMFDGLVMEGSSIPPTPSPSPLDFSRQLYERPSCPTPNSRSDLSVLLKRKTSQTPPSSGNTKQRRPTPVVYHFIESESLRGGRQRKISPVVQRMRKISGGKFAVYNIPLEEENEEHEDLLQYDDIEINKQKQKRSSYLTSKVKKTSNSRSSPGEADNLNSVFKNEDDTQAIGDAGNNLGKNYSYALKMMAEMDNYNIRESQRRSMDQESTSANKQKVMHKKFQRTKSMPIVQLSKRKRHRLSSN